MQKHATTPVLPPDEKKIRTIEKATVVDLERFEATSVLGAVRGELRRQFLKYFFCAPPLWRIGLRAMTSRRRVVPSFASLGAPRSGTTLLSDYIMQHPCVVLPLAKEVYSPYPALRLTMAQFPTLREIGKIERKYGTAITGYCTPVIPNFLFPYAFSAITEKLKLILLLRNPVDRMFAHWRYAHVLTTRLQRDPLWKNYPDFPELARVEVEALKKFATSGFVLKNCGGFIQHSIYLPFLKHLFRFYDRRDAIFINSSDFFADPSGTAQRIYEFLDLPRYVPVDLPVRNAGPKAEMDPETREMLANFFEPLNRELYEFIGEDFSW